MTRMMLACSLLFFVSTAAGQEDAKASGPPKVGDTAPNFKLKASDGKEYELSAFKGKMGVVLAWYPKAFTGG